MVLSLVAGSEFTVCVSVWSEFHIKSISQIEDGVSFIVVNFSISNEILDKSIWILDQTMNISR